MNKKNILTILVSVIVMGVSIYFIYSLLFPKKPDTTVDTTNKTEGIQTVPSSFDETTYKAISILSDYGKPALSGIGKGDIFSDF